MISVVILTLNSAEFIQPCLDSILNQEKGVIELIVVDNGSNDATAALVKENYPQVKLIENKLNLGAARARNQGIEASGGEWILSLDCDVVLSKDFFCNINNFLKELPSGVGLIQPKILEFKEKTIYSTGISVSFLRRFFDTGRGKKDRGQFDKTKYIFGACSAAALYNKKMLNAIKEGVDYFDESFFFLFEDVDLSWRAQKKKYKAIFFPKAVCFHYGNSSQTPKKTRQYLSLRNRYYTLLKNDSIGNCILAFLIYDFPRLIWLFIINPSVLKAIQEAFVYRNKLSCPKD
jgi:hypothetical protein